MCRHLNENIAGMVQAAPERFYGLGAVPLQDIDAAVAELEHLCKSLKLSGVEVASHINGVSIGDRRFDVAYTGMAAIKDYRTYSIVGASVPRNDIPAKAAGTYVYMHHVRLPGMLHGRIVRPRGQGAYADAARVTSVDAASIADIPGARVIRRRDFVGVVAAVEVVVAGRGAQGRRRGTAGPTGSCSPRCAASRDSSSGAPRGAGYR